LLTTIQRLNIGRFCRPEKRHRYRHRDQRVNPTRAPRFVELACTGRISSNNRIRCARLQNGLRSMEQLSLDEQTLHDVDRRRHISVACPCGSSGTVQPMASSTRLRSLLRQRSKGSDTMRFCPFNSEIFWAMVRGSVVGPIGVNESQLLPRTVGRTSGSLRSCILPVSRE
jgi:hypothetical protein